MLFSVILGWAKHYSGRVGGSCSSLWAALCLTCTFSCLIYSRTPTTLLRQNIFAALFLSPSFQQHLRQAPLCCYYATLSLSLIFFLLVSPICEAKQLIHSPTLTNSLTHLLSHSHSHPLSSQKYSRLSARIPTGNCDSSSGHPK